jgi:hypothetical protein
MSAYIRDDWKPPAKLYVRIEGRKVLKQVKDYFFTSAPEANSDNLNLRFTDGCVVQVDYEFVCDNDKPKEN